jgi:putative transposase
MAARWGYFEDSVRLAAALRPALAARGVPDAIYVDNGSAFVDAALKRAAARLGIKITHSAPGRPQGRGKIERFFGLVRQEFLVEVGDGAGIKDLARLNKLFTAWYETVYHARPHGETGQPPIERWLAGGPVPCPVAGAAARGVLVGRAADRRQDRHHQAVRRRL